jgi:DNA-directed RNA polymerase subunit RPC12/RpoP
MHVVPKPLPAFDEYFKRVTDTNLKCPNCGGRILQGRGKADPKNLYNTRQLYACQCMGHECKNVSKVTIEHWKHLLTRPSNYLCCALPTPDLVPDDKATMQRTGTYDPSIGEGGTRAERWAEASRIAREAIEELIGVQSEYEYWRDNLPEGLAEGATAELLNEVCNLNLDDALDILEEADQVALPKGFGRD